MIDWALFFDGLQPAAVLTTATLGIFIGAFYGFELSRDARIVYPWTFWVLGVAWLVTVAILAALDPGGAYRLEPSLARVVLWTVLSAGIPLGRFLRISLYSLRLRSRTRALRRPRSSDDDEAHL